MENATMRYFFHVEGSGKDSRDEVGEIFSSFDEAKDHVAGVAHDLRRDGYQSCMMCVEDESGNQVARMPMATERGE